MKTVCEAKAWKFSTKRQKHGSKCLSSICIYAIFMTSHNTIISKERNLMETINSMQPTRDQLDYSIVNKHTDKVQPLKHHIAVLKDLQCPCPHF